MGQIANFINEDLSKACPGEWFASCFSNTHHQGKEGASFVKIEAHGAEPSSSNKKPVTVGRSNRVITSSRDAKKDLHWLDSRRVLRRSHGAVVVTNPEKACGLWGYHGCTSASFRHSSA